MTDAQPLFPGDIYYSDIGANEDHMVIVVSRRMLNDGDYVVIVPVTSKRFEERRRLPNCVPLLRGQVCFTKNCVARARIRSR